VRIEIAGKKGQPDRMAPFRTHGVWVAHRFDRRRMTETAIKITAGCTKRPDQSPAATQTEKPALSHASASDRPAIPMTIAKKVTGEIAQVGCWLFARSGDAS